MDESRAPVGALFVAHSEFDIRGVSEGTYFPYEYNGGLGNERKGNEYHGSHMNVKE